MDDDKKHTEEFETLQYNTILALITCIVNLYVAIMHCVTRDMGSRSKMNLSLVLNPRVAVMKLNAYVCY